MKKRIISLLLALVMVITLFPMGAFAATQSCNVGKIKSFSSTLTKQQYNLLKSGNITATKIDDVWYYKFYNDKYDLLVKASAFENTCKNTYKFYDGNDKLQSVSKVLSAGVNETVGSGTQSYYFKSNGVIIPRNFFGGGGSKVTNSTNTYTTVLADIAVSSSTEKSGSQYNLKCKLKSNIVFVYCPYVETKSSSGKYVLTPLASQKALTGNLKRTVNSTLENQSIRPVFSISIDNYNESGVVLKNYYYTGQGSVAKKTGVGDWINIVYLTSKAASSPSVGSIYSVLDSAYNLGLESESEKYVITEKIDLSSKNTKLEPVYTHKATYASPIYLSKVGDYIDIEQGISKVNCGQKATVTFYADVAKPYIPKPSLSVSVSSSKTTLTWDKVENADYYVVQTSTKSSSDWTKVKKIELGQDTSCTVNTPNFASELTKYRVVAYTMDGKYSKASNTVQKYSYKPKAPTALNKATGIKVTVGDLGGATGCYIYRKAGSGEWKKIATINPTKTKSYLDTNVKNGTKYQYKIYAYIKSGDTIYKSLASAVTTKYYLSAPNFKSLSSTSAGKITVKVAKDTAATQLEIRYSSNSFKSYESVKVSCSSDVSKTISSLTKGKEYKVKVRAIKTVSGTTYYSQWTGIKSITVKK